jgi:Pyridoxamine 5'-phosphate oxidase
MPDRESASAEPMTEDAATPTPWARARSLLEGARATYWLATVRPDGTPHVMPLLAVWVDGGLFFSAGERTRKARNLALDSHCVVTAEEEPLDLVLEGKAVKVRDAATLQRVADAYAEVYGWRVAVRDAAFHDTEGAPTAGPPPYDVYEVAPKVAFGFGTDETLVPTRWRFGE